MGMTFFLASGTTRGTQQVKTAVRNEAQVQMFAAKKLSNGSQKRTGYSKARPSAIWLF
jgi:hypothetical protein